MSYLQDKQDLKMANYFQAPNEIIDSIVGTVVSANAAWVVMTVWRYTEGMTDKLTGDKRKSAPIPAKTFMRVLGINRDKTVYKYVNEAIESGLINAEKGQGKITQYSINHHCEHWHGDKKVVAENAPSQVVAESATSGEKRPKVVAENAPATTGEKRHTYKERDNKEIYINKNKEKNKKENPEPEKPKRQRKHDFVLFDFTDNQKSRCSEYGIHIDHLLNEFRDYHEARGNQFVDWSKAFNNWINNHIKFNKLQPQSQGMNHANNQPANTTGNKPTQNHFDMLREQLAREYAGHDSGPKTIN